MIIKTLQYFFCTACCLFVISTNVDANNVIKINSDNIRVQKIGDSQTYATVIAGSGSALSGTLTQLISKTVTNPYGISCLERTITGIHTGIGGPTPLNLKILFYQDQQHSLFECGFYNINTSSYVFIVDSHSTPNGLTLTLQSPVTIGNTTSTLTTFTDGTWKDCNRTVQSIEEVSTAVGTYETYKITENCLRSEDTSKTTTQIWLAPNLMIIKEYGTGDFITGNFILNNYQLD